MLLHILVAVVEDEQELLIGLVQRSAKLDIHVASDDGTNQECHPKHPVEEVEGQEHSAVIRAELLVILRVSTCSCQSEKYAKHDPLARERHQVDIEQATIGFKGGLVQLLALQKLANSRQAPEENCCNVQENHANSHSPEEVIGD